MQHDNEQRTTTPPQAMALESVITDQAVAEHAVMESKGNLERVVTDVHEKALAYHNSPAVTL